MTNAIKTQVTIALQSAGAYGKAIAALRDKLQGQTRDEVRAVLLPYVAAHYGLDVVSGQRGDRFSEGKETVRGNNASQALKNMARDIAGTAEKQAPSVRVSRELQVAINKLVAQYDKQMVREAIKRAE